MSGAVSAHRFSCHPRVTPDGEALLSHGRQMLRINEEAMSRFRAPPLEGKIRFGAPDDFGTRFLPRILARFAKTHLSVEVEVKLSTTVSLLSLMDAGELDLCLITATPDAPGPAGAAQLLSEPLIWVGLQGGTAKDEPRLPLALADNTCSWRASALRALDVSGRDYRIAYTCENCQGQMAALLADLAVAPLPASLLQPGYERIGPREGLPEMGGYQLKLSVRSGPDPVVKVFAEHVMDSFKGGGERYSAAS